MSRIEELEKRLAADPSSRMFVQLAEEYRKAGMLEQAIDCCEKGLKKHPQYPSARVLLGRALLESGSLDKASAEFETVLKQVPDNILAHKFLGETYRKLGRLDEALKKYRVANTLAPEDTELGERIQEVQAEIAGGPRPAPPQPVSVPAPPAPPIPLVEAAPPAPRPPDPPRPAPAAVPIRPAPPIPIAAIEPEPEIERTARMIDLPPIPLVEVDEPMVLEGRDYIPPPKAPSAPSTPPAPRPAPPPAPEFQEIDPEDLLEPTIFELPPAPPGEVPQPPPPAPPPPTVAPVAPAPAAEIETATMAEIYAAQGHFDQALAVYRRIVERQPNETQYRARIEELLMLSRAAAAPKATSKRADDSYGADEHTVRVLEDWLEAIRNTKAP